MKSRASLLAVLLSIASAAVADEDPRPIPQDRFGRPLFAADGSPLEYAGPQDAPWVPQDQATPEAPARPKTFDALAMRDHATLGCYTQDLGTRGIVARDLDQDGVPEIVVGHGAMWYVVALDPRTGTYVQRSFHEYGQGGVFGGGRIAEIRVGDLGGDGALEIVVLTGDGFLDTYDRHGTLVTSSSLGVSSPTDLEVEDVDPAAGDEIVVLDASTLRVFGPASATPLWSLPGLGGVDLAVGNVDADPAREIVIATGGGAGQVVDASLRVTEWAFPAGFGAYVDVGDIDGDGMDEIAGCADWGDCRAVDGDTRLQKWSFDNFDSSAVHCADVTGDGIAEVGIGDGQWGDVTFRRGSDGQAVSALRNPEHSVAHVDVADVDGDCELEVLWGAGYSSSGSDRLYVGDLARSLIEWENVENDGPMNAFVIADIDADGETEVVHASAESDAGYDGTLVYVTDLHARLTEVMPSGPVTRGFSLTQGTTVIQADADPQLEYVLRNETWPNDTIAAYDGITHAADWTAVDLGNETVLTLLTADPDGDGDDDVVAGTSSYLRIFQATDGAVLYRDPSAVGQVAHVRVADVEPDGAQEIVYLLDGTGVRVVDGATRASEWSLNVSGASGLDVADVVPGGALEILIGDDSGALAARDGLSHAEVFRRPLGAGSIHAIRAGDIDGDGDLEIAVSQAVGASGESVVKVVRPSDGIVLWTSPRIVGSAGAGSSLYILDADDDGKKEICVSGAYSVRFFEHQDGVIDAAPPTFLGAADVRGIVSSTCCPSVVIAWEEARDDRMPPMEYRIHRGETPGFPIDATSLVGTTPGTSWCDANTAAATTYWYAVRAADRAGNEDGNDVRLSVVTPDSTPPLAVTIDSATDLASCGLTGVELAFTPASPPPDVRFDLLVDGAVGMSDVQSPLVFLPGNANPHRYAIVAVKLTCPISTFGAEVTATDAGSVLPAPTILGVTDADNCLPDGVDVVFTHGGFPGAGRYDVERDGVVVATDVTSPARIVPPDAGMHSYVVTAVDITCGVTSHSAAANGSDRSRQPVAPSAVSLSDVDTCALSNAELSFTHPGFPAGGHYELWRDGVLYLSPVFDGQILPASDALAHAFVVRAHDDSCDVWTDAAPVSYTDSTDCPSAAGEVPLRVRRIAGAPDAVEVTWMPAPGVTARHDAYVGTLASLHGARAYDHSPSAVGVTFPDAPDPASGCGVAGAVVLRARIDGLRSGDYLLIVAVDVAGIPGPFGARSDGIDRHDFSVDPRPRAAFCP